MRLFLSISTLLAAALSSAACGGTTASTSSEPGGSSPQKTSGDASPFACGDITCKAGEFCEVEPAGIEAVDASEPITNYQCQALPAACADSPTCDCLGKALPSGSGCSPAGPPGAACTGSDGHVTVVCDDA